MRTKLLKDVANPIGQYILIENVPFQVVGVLAEKGASSGDTDSDDRIAIPYSAASVRLFGTHNPNTWPSRRRLMRARSKRRKPPSSS